MLRPLLTLPILFLLGCNNAGLVPVSGTVTLDGKPLPDASVLFAPLNVPAGKPALQSYGKTDAEGKFTLQTIDDDVPGCLTGEHRVEISCAASQNPSDDAAAVIEKVPESQRRHSFTVPPAGTSKADFALKSSE